MILGWITGSEYTEQHDPAGWRIAGRSATKRQARAESRGAAD
jgi:hypothetical protein